VIGDVDALERGEPGAQDVLLGEELQLTAAVSQANERRLPEAAPEHDAPEHEQRLLIAERLDLLWVVTQLFLIDQGRSKLETQLVDGAALVQLHVVGKRVLALLAQPSGLFAPLLDERLF
jgi:hypothetical protein